MSRRRMMMLQNASKENWDFNWNYKQGLLSKYAPNTRFSGNGAEELTDKGLLLTANGGNADYVIYEFLPLRSNKAIYEVLITVDTFGESDGLVMSLSQGDKGCQIYVQNNAVCYEAGKNVNDTPKIISQMPIALNTEYLIRLEYDNVSGNKITVNDTSVYEGSKFSSYWCTKNLIKQQKSGSTYLKEVRFKHIA